jgi:hypothetical protein
LYLLRYNFVRMAFRIETIEDLIRLLEERPEWRERLREVLLTPEERMASTGISWHSTDRSHQDALQRLNQLKDTVERLAVKSKKLVEGSYSSDAYTDRFANCVTEMRYYARGPAPFGRYVNRPRVVDLAQFIDDLREGGCKLSEKEWDELSLIDLLLSAKHPETKAPLYLAVEISWMLVVDDVERARERAAILRRCGVEAYPALAGEGITPEAQEMVSRFGILTLLGGRGLIRTLGT